MTGVLSNWRGYLELTKPGVQALLFVSCASGMLIGSDFNPPTEVFFFGLIGISFLAASSAVINHFFDKQIDSKMIRTSERPLVMGDITDNAAISFSVPLYLVGAFMLLYFTNFLTWILTTLTFIFYAFIYTKYLKFMTSQNIVIGGSCRCYATTPWMDGNFQYDRTKCVVVSSYNNGLDSSSFLGFGCL